MLLSTLILDPNELKTPGHVHLLRNPSNLCGPLSISDVTPLDAVCLVFLCSLPRCSRLHFWQVGTWQIALDIHATSICFCPKCSLQTSTRGELEPSNCEAGVWSQTARREARAGVVSVRTFLAGTRSAFIAPPSARTPPEVRRRRTPWATPWGRRWMSSDGGPRAALRSKAGAAEGPRGAGRGEVDMAETLRCGCGSRK